MNTAKRVAGILILLVHVIGGFMVGRVFVILFFASQSELSLNPDGYDRGPRRDPVTLIWFLGIAGVLSVLIFGPLLYLLGRRFPRVASYSLATASDALWIAVHSQRCRAGNIGS